MTNKINLRRGATLALALSLFGAAVNADTLNATNYGGYSEQGRHVGYNFNFATGYSGPNNNQESRGFFTFDLSSIAANIGSATLHLWNSTPVAAPPGYLGYNSNDLTETVNIYSVSTVGAAAALSSHANESAAGNAAGIALYNDLGSGALLGTLTVSKAASIPGSYANVVFNAAGIAAINASAGGIIAFGSALGSLAKNPLFDEFLFSGWGNDANYPYPGFNDTRAQLEVNPVPLPGAVWLLGSALAGLGAMRRKRLAVAA